MKRISFIITVLLVLILILIPIIGLSFKEPSLVESKRYDGKIGELHSIRGVENYYKLFTNQSFQVESFKKIKFPMLNYSLGWDSNGKKKVESLIDYSKGPGKSAEGKWDVYSSFRYDLKEKSFLNLIKIQYISPKNFRDIELNNKRECNICNEFPEEKGSKIKKELLPMGISTHSFETETKTEFQFKDDVNTTLTINIKYTKNKGVPYISIKSMSQDKIYYLYKNGIIHFKNNLILLDEVK